jgi:hypothetical protein
MKRNETGHNGRKGDRFFKKWGKVEDKKLFVIFCCEQRKYESENSFKIYSEHCLNLKKVPENSSSVPMWSLMVIHYYATCSGFYGACARGGPAHSTAAGQPGHQGLFYYKGTATYKIHIICQKLVSFIKAVRWFHWPDQLSDFVLAPVPFSAKSGYRNLQKSLIK